MYNVYMIVKENKIIKQQVMTDVLSSLESILSITKSNLSNIIQCPKTAIYKKFKSDRTFNTKEIMRLFYFLKSMSNGYYERLEEYNCFDSIDVKLLKEIAKLNTVAINKQLEKLKSIVDKKN